MEIVSLSGDESPDWPLAKLGCFLTQKKINVFTFNQAQTSLRGGPIRVFRLLLAFDFHEQGQNEGTVLKMPA